MMRSHFLMHKNASAPDAPGGGAERERIISTYVEIIRTWKCASLLAPVSVGPTTRTRRLLAAGLRRFLLRKREQAGKLPHSKRWRGFPHGLSSAFVVLSHRSRRQRLALLHSLSPNLFVPIFLSVSGKIRVERGRQENGDKKMITGASAPGLELFHELPDCFLELVKILTARQMSNVETRPRLPPATPITA